MTDVAIMIPMTDQRARRHNAHLLRPEGWDPDRSGLVFPELWEVGGQYEAPLFGGQITDRVEEAVHAHVDSGKLRMTIITRHILPVLCVRRLIASADPGRITGAVYLVTSPGQRIYRILPDGTMESWHTGLFEEEADERRSLQEATESHKRRF